MATRLIRLSDGTLIEVEVNAEQSEPISGGAARRVDTALERIAPTLVKACQPVVSAWSELQKNVVVEAAEVEIGFAFEAEGNLYVTRSTAHANLTIKLTLKEKTA